jgi:hypothetical protein
MEENGNEIGNKTKRDRDIKGRFIRGGPPGPGRGKRSDDIERLDFWDATEQMIRRDLKSKNEGTRLKAVALYFKWKVMKEADKNKEDVVSVAVSPIVLEALKKVRCEPEKKLNFEKPDKGD